MALGYGRTKWTNEDIRLWKKDWKIFLSQFKKVFSEKSSMKFSKLHQAEHIPDLIHQFGAPCEWKALDYETVHKRAKLEGKNWNHQSSIESILLNRVYFLYKFIFIVFRILNIKYYI